MVDQNQTVPEEEVLVFVGGNQFSGWEKVQITRDLEAASGSFQLEVSNRTPWPITPGAQIDVLVNGEQVVSGFVDDLSIEIKPRQRLYRIAGRDKTADLVDASEITDGGEFVALTIVEIAERICAPFGITVNNQLTDFGLEKFVRFKVQPGETAWSAIERAGRLRSVLAYSEGDGALTIAPAAAGFAETDLFEGPRGNVEQATIAFSQRNRFATYIVRGQRRGSDEAFGIEVAQIQGQATDPAVGRYRPLLVVGEGAMTFESAQDRANWEATIRAARAAQVNVTVAGWRQVADDRGRIWRLNELVPTKIPSAQLDALLLVKGIQFTRDRGVTATKLTLTRQDAYIPKPEVESESDPFEQLINREAVTFG